MYAILGWLNVFLLVVMTAPYWLRFLNNHTLRLKGGAYGKTIKVLRTIHKPLGIVIVLIALVHGYLALGALRIHTGLILWLMIFITASLGASFYFTKKKSLFVWHKRMVLVVILFLLIHRLFPNAVYTLFH
jgi:hypothetical protein